MRQYKKRNRLKEREKMNNQYLMLNFKWMKEKKGTR
jgi:hypothetical protein